ncbi:MAG: 30S ribosomal protein S13 [Nanobdellota archaeon]
MAEDIRYIVRIANTDLDGKKNVCVAMTGIKGVDRMLANAACMVIGLDPAKKAGSLTDAELKKLEDVIKSPGKYDIPSWMMNRRKDYEDGEDKHLLTSDLALVEGGDLKRLKKMKSYRGMRHSWGLTTRGQRTKANFRNTRSKGKR